jgi:hypothetical protein
MTVLATAKHLLDRRKTAYNTGLASGVVGNSNKKMTAHESNKMV